MKRLLAVLLLCIILAAAGWLLLPRKQERHGRLLVSKKTAYAVWSRDSRKLFYIISNPHGRQYRLHRYDVRYGDDSVVETPGEIECFDVSPDGKSVVYVKPGKIVIQDLSTGRTQTVYSVSAKKWRQDIGIRKAYWLKPDVILFNEGGRGKRTGIYLLDISTGKTRQIPVSYQNLEKIGCDGECFIYENMANKYCLYDIATGKSTVLDEAHGLHCSHGEGTFLYVSRSLVICILRSGPEGVGMSVAYNVKKRKAHQISLENNSYLMAISPDLSRYWVGYPGSGDWYSEPSQLYAVEIPAKTVQLLRR